MVELKTVNNVSNIDELNNGITQDKIVQNLVKIFGAEVTKEAFNKVQELDNNGHFGILDKNDNIIYRGTRLNCINEWLNGIDVNNYKVCELEYAIFLNKDTGKSYIPNELSIVKTIIE
jgi:Zn-dependent M16 (insulinase) family peptidase